MMLHQILPQELKGSVEVVLYGAYRDIKLVSDLLIALSLPTAQVEDLLLAGGELSNNTLGQFIQQTVVNVFFGGVAGCCLVAAVVVFVSVAGYPSFKLIKDQVFSDTNQVSIKDLLLVEFIAILPYP